MNRRKKKSLLIQLFSALLKGVWLWLVMSSVIFLASGLINGWGQTITYFTAIARTLQILAEALSLWVVEIPSLLENVLDSMRMLKESAFADSLAEARQAEQITEDNIKGMQHITGNAVAAAMALLIVNVVFIGLLVAVVIVSIEFVSELFRRSRRPSFVLTRPPAYRTTKLFSFLLYKKEKVRIYDPIYSDFFLEYCEAVKSKQKWRARWLHLRFYFDVVKAFSLQTAAKLLWGVVDFVRKPVDGGS